METEVKLTKLASCSGCGAKVGAGVLSELLGSLPARRDPDLLVGFDSSDDACVYRINDETAIVQTVDFFPPITDDPYTFGQIAAANAMSDVYAMGADPKLALNIMAIPQDLPREAVHDILRGGYDKTYEAGVIISGGHSIIDKEPKYGLCVTGFVHPGRVITNKGAVPGDILFLTKPLGIGIITTAAKVSMASEKDHAAAIDTMVTLNRAARDVMVKYNVHACTDVTGFGLMGHCLEMAQGSNTQIHIYTTAVPILSGARRLAETGILPEGMYRNRRFAQDQVDTGDIPLALQDILFDPQTSGGLLISIDPEDASRFEEELKEKIPCASKVGSVQEYTQGARICLH